jgi:hypothetical protein
VDERTLAMLEQHGTKALIRLRGCVLPAAASPQLDIDSA